MVMSTVKSFFLYYAITKVYVAGMLSFRQLILKFILFVDAKNHKLAIAQTCDFLYASINKIN